MEASLSRYDAVLWAQAAKIEDQFRTGTRGSKKRIQAHLPLCCLHRAFEPPLTLPKLFLQHLITTACCCPRLLPPANSTNPNCELSRKATIGNAKQETLARFVAATRSTAQHGTAQHTAAHHCTHLRFSEEHSVSSRLFWLTTTFFSATAPVAVFSSSTRCLSAMSKIDLSATSFSLA